MSLNGVTDGSRPVLKDFFFASHVLAGIISNATLKTALIVTGLYFCESNCVVPPFLVPPDLIKSGLGLTQSVTVCHLVDQVLESTVASCFDFALRYGQCYSY